MDPFGLPTDFTLPTTDELKGLVDKAALLERSFEAAGDRIEAEIAAHKESVLAEATESIRSLPLSPAERAGAMKAAKLKANVAAKRFREETLEENGGCLDDQLRQLHEADQKAQGLMRVYPSPQALLSTQHLGDPRRTEYLNQIVHASTAEVATMARIAIATNNRALAAAVQSRLDSMPKADRPFHAGEFATRIVGEEHAKFAMAAKVTSHALQASINRNRTLASGERNLFQELRLGIIDTDIRQNIMPM